jgi:hypothetical protein
LMPQNADDDEEEEEAAEEDTLPAWARLTTAVALLEPPTAAAPTPAPLLPDPEADDAEVADEPPRGRQRLTTHIPTRVVHATVDMMIPLLTTCAVCASGVVVRSCEDEKKKKTQVELQFLLWTLARCVVRIVCRALSFECRAPKRSR